MDLATVIDVEKLPTGVPTELVEWVQSLKGLVQGLESENAKLREKVQQLTKTVGELRDEIAALKGQKGRPVIKPSGMDKQTEAEESEDEQGRGRGKEKKKSDKGPKTARLVIHEERKVKAGLSNWEFTEVQDGLDAGERVVTSLERTGVKAGAAYTLEEEAQGK